MKPASYKLNTVFNREILIQGAIANKNDLVYEALIKSIDFFGALNEERICPSCVRAVNEEGLDWKLKLPNCENCKEHLDRPFTRELEIEYLEWENYIPDIPHPYF